VPLEPACCHPNREGGVAGGQLTWDVGNDPAEDQGSKRSFFPLLLCYYEYEVTHLSLYVRSYCSTACPLAGMGIKREMLITELCHRITERFGLEGTLKIIQFQPPCRGQGHLPLGQVAQSPIQPGLEHC